MGPRDSAGLQVGVPLATPTKNLPILPSGQNQSGGPNNSSEEPNPERRLDGEARPQGCFPLCPNPSNTSEIPPLPMGGAGMGISDPAIWFKQCTICVHEVTKTSGSDLAQAGNGVGLVFGRYADSCSDQRDDKRMPSNSAGAAFVTWFHHQLEEECAQPNSEDRISGFSD